MMTLGINTDDNMKEQLIEVDDKFITRAEQDV